MKVFGHPLHNDAIHFPTALLPMDVLFSFFAYYNESSSFLPAAFYCLAARIIAGGLALTTGIIDLLMIQKDKKTAMSTALIHGFINALVLCFFWDFSLSKLANLSAIDYTSIIHFNLESFFDSGFVCR